LAWKRSPRSPECAIVSITRLIAFKFKKERAIAETAQWKEGGKNGRTENSRWRRWSYLHLEEGCSRRNRRLERACDGWACVQSRRTRENCLFICRSQGRKIDLPKGPCFPAGEVGADWYDSYTSSVCELGPCQAREISPSSQGQKRRNQGAASILFDRLSFCP